MGRLPGLIFLACFLPALAVAGDEIYRSEDEEGNITYTDTPSAGDTSAERIELPPGPSEESLRQSEQRNLQIRKAISETERRRRQQQSQQKSRTEAAQKRLREAEAKLEEAKVIQDEDRQNLAGGKRRIKPEYFERVKAAEAAVEEARKALREARGY